MTDSTQISIPLGMVTAVAKAIHDADIYDDTIWPDNDAPTALRVASPEIQAIRLEQATQAVEIILGWKDEIDAK